MRVEIFYALILAHLIGDFILQFNGIVSRRFSKKGRESVLGNLQHAGIHLLTAFTAYILVSAMVSLPWFSYSILGIIIFISIMHFFIDYGKSLLILQKPFVQHSIFWFFVDQLAHLFIIVAACYGPVFFAFFYDQSLRQAVITIYDSFSLHTPVQKLFVLAGGVVIGLWGVGTFIKIFMDWMQYKSFKHIVNCKMEMVKWGRPNGVRDGGFLIGLLERTLIICAIVLDQPQVIGFALAAKSIARFKKFDDDSFVEYFIIGTFLSFIPAIIIGVFIKQKVLPI